MAKTHSKGAAGALTPPKLAILLALGERGPMSAAALLKAPGIGGAITSLWQRLDGLKALGLVGPAGGPGTRAGWCLTPEGVNALDELEAAQRPPQARREGVST